MLSWGLPLQVDGMDLRDASHEQAVEAIRKAGNPVVFMVQSIINRPRVSKQKGQGRQTQTVFNLEANVTRAKLSLRADSQCWNLRRLVKIYIVLFLFLFFFIELSWKSLLPCLINTGSPLKTQRSRIHWWPSVSRWIIVSIHHSHKIYKLLRGTWYNHLT